MHPPLQSPVPCSPNQLHLLGTRLEKILLRNATGSNTPAEAPRYSKHVLEKCLVLLTRFVVKEGKGKMTALEAKITIQLSTSTRGEEKVLCESIKHSSGA